MFNTVDKEKHPHSLNCGGGISSGAAMAAMFCLGAEGVQIGTRFVASNESSAHQNFKNAVINVKEGDTVLTLKELTPVRLIKNPFFQTIKQAIDKGASKEELAIILGKGRAKRECTKVILLRENLKSVKRPPW
jgi:enoyl-[acyl-carrier protein] reductase II